MSKFALAWSIITMFVDATYTAFLVPMGIAFHFKAQYFSWYNAVDIAAGKQAWPCSLYPTTNTVCKIHVNTEMSTCMDAVHSLIIVAAPSPMKRGYAAYGLCALPEQAGHKVAGPRIFWPVVL